MFPRSAEVVDVRNSSISEMKVSPPRLALNARTPASQQLARGARVSELSAVVPTRGGTVFVVGVLGVVNVRMH